MTLLEAFRKVIVLNECGGDERVALEFSDPDGVRSGKSGWSFGICQFDLLNNPLAAICLKECGFTDDEIVGLKAQTIDEKPLAKKLRDHADIIARYDEHQLDGCLTRAKIILDRFAISPSDDTATIACADYDNQYHLDAVSKPTTLIGYLASIKRTFIAKDVLDFKISGTKYGREHPDDCRRRYMNILKVMQNG